MGITPINSGREYMGTGSRSAVANHGWELIVNYPAFTMVMVIYHYVERILRIIVAPYFSYNMYDHEKYYPGEPVNIHIQ